MTGLDRLQIDPAVSRRTGTSHRGHYIQKDTDDKLYATYSALADVEEGHILKLEPCEQHTSLIGVREERGGIEPIKIQVQFR